MPGPGTAQNHDCGSKKSVNDNAGSKRHFNSQGTLHTGECQLIKNKDYGYTGKDRRDCTFHNRDIRYDNISRNSCTTHQ
ncbi:hypothetical protein EVA_20139 [gut metagenome]|uniref:Uncharacterized protein n=1 Tax=gut metagenome TaxID=749906 RepID=J9FWN3_9ZZZZ